MATEDPDQRSVWEQVLKGAALLLLLSIAAVLVFAFSAIGRGQAAMTRSDAAFHAGDLRLSIREARAAALAYVPGARHVKEAEARLLAIARGAEVEGRRDLARAAWDALRVAEEQTSYPGRGRLPLGEEARAAIERLDHDSSAGENRKLAPPLGSAPKSEP